MQATPPSPRNCRDEAQALPPPRCLQLARTRPATGPPCARRLLLSPISAGSLLNFACTLRPASAASSSRPPAPNCADSERFRSTVAAIGSKSRPSGTIAAVASVSRSARGSITVTQLHGGRAGASRQPRGEAHPPPPENRERRGRPPGEALQNHDLRSAFVARPLLANTHASHGPQSVVNGAPGGVRIIIGTGGALGLGPPPGPPSVVNGVPRGLPSNVGALGFGPPRWPPVRPEHGARGSECGGALGFGPPPGPPSDHDART